MLILLILHSIIRWIILILGLAAIVKFLLGWLGGKNFGKLDRGLSAGFSGLMDAQVLLGMIYFVITGMAGAGFPMFRIEHLVTMLLAAVVAHVPSMLKRKGNRYLIGLVAVIGALLLVYVGVARLPGGWNR